MAQLRAFAKKTWRATSRRLPPKVAEAIRKPAKEGLRKLGLIGRSRRR